MNWDNLGFLNQRSITEHFCDGLRNQPIQDANKPIYRPSILLYNHILSISKYAPLTSLLTQGALRRA
jgi:hypothetical protein